MGCSSIALEISSRKSHCLTKFAEDAAQQQSSVAVHPHPDHCFAAAALLHSSACKLLTRNPVCTGCNSAHTSHPVQFSLHQCNFSGAQCTGNMAAQCRWCTIFYLHGHWRSMLVIVWCSLTSCSWLQSWRLQYQLCDNLLSVWMNIMRIEG